MNNPIGEGGLTELIGVDEQVAQNKFGGSVGVTLDATLKRSGEIVSLALYSTGGGILTPAGKLLVLDADPAVAVGDAALAAAEWATVLGVVAVAAGDWVADAAGAAVFKADVGLAFHAVQSLYFVWLHQDATTFNSDAGDDELLQLNFWYRRDS